MKKGIFLLGFFIFLSNNLFSQEEGERFLRLGIYGSANPSWIKSRTKEHQSDGLLLRFGYGLLSEFSLAKNYALTTGIFSTYNGGKLTWKWDSITITPPDTLKKTIDIFSKYKFHAIEVPLYLKLKTKEFNYITFFANFGGSASFLIDSKVEYNYSWDNKEINEEMEVNKDVYFYRIAFIIGGGIEYSIFGTTNLICGADFNNGLTQLFNTSKKSIHMYDDDKKKAINNYVSIKIGVIF